LKIPSPGIFFPKIGFKKEKKLKIPNPEKNFPEIGAKSGKKISGLGSFRNKHAFWIFFEILIIF